MAQDFHPGDDGRLEPLDLRGHGHFLEHSVNAVADAQFVFERLEVDVRRAQFNGVAQHLVDEADDGGILGGAVQVRVLILAVIDDLERRFFVQGVDGVGPDAEPLLHLPLDSLAGSEDGLELQAR